MTSRGVVHQKKFGLLPKTSTTQKKEIRSEKISAKAKQTEPFCFYFQNEGDSSFFIDVDENYRTGTGTIP